MKKKKQIDFRDRNLLFVDLETTGLDVETHEILEVGCILVNGKSLEIIEEYQTRVKPTHIETASKNGLKVSGYSKDLWKKEAISLKKALRRIVKMAPDAMIAGWKVDFDWSFLNKALNENGIKHSFDYHLIDVISMAYAHFRSKKRPSGLGLRKVASVLKIKMTEKHDALGDIMGTYQVFRKLMKVK